MTIASQTTAETLLGDGANRKFPFTFRAWEGEARVVVTDPDDHADDVTALADIDFDDYTGLGGTVTYPAAEEADPLPEGWKLTILRDMDFLQPVRLVNATRYDPLVMEQALDRLAATCQQLREQAGRAVQVPVGSGKTSQEFITEIYAFRDYCLDLLARMNACVDAAEIRLDEKAGETIAALCAELEDCLAQVDPLLAQMESAAASATLAEKWAANPVDEPVTAAGPDGPAQFSAYHWAHKAQAATGIDDASTTQKGLAYAATAEEVAAGLTDPARDGAPAFVTPETLPPPPSVPEIPLAAPAAPGLAPSGGQADQVYKVNADGTAYEWGNAQSGIFIGKIDLLPYRPTTLVNRCPGWYLCNGDLYPLSGAVGAALNALPATFKSDWGITVTDDNISIPKLFHTDGRGYFLRAVPGAGTGNTPGRVEGDAIRNISGEITPRSWLHQQSGNVGATPRTNSSVSGPFYMTASTLSSDYIIAERATANLASARIYFDPSRVVPTAAENRPINIGMTPAIYLGV